MALCREQQVRVEPERPELRAVGEGIGDLGPAGGRGMDARQCLPHRAREIDVDPSRRQFGFPAGIGIRGQEFHREHVPRAVFAEHLRHPARLDGGHQRDPCDFGRGTLRRRVPVGLDVQLGERPLHHDGRPAFHIDPPHIAGDAAAEPADGKLLALAQQAHARQCRAHFAQILDLFPWRHNLL